MLIRRAGPADIEPALAVMSDAFDMPLRAPTVHTLVARVPGGTLLVAEEDGVILGTAASIAFGPTGWLGGITVTPEARGRGLGRELTEAAMEAFGPRETVLLLASALGRPIYDRLGFVAEGEYRVFTAEAAGAGEFAAARRCAPRPAGDGGGPVGRAAGRGRFRDAVAFRPPWPALPILGGDGAEVLLRGLVAPGLRLAVPAANARAVAVLSRTGRGAGRAWCGCASGPPWRGTRARVGRVLAVLRLDAP